MKKIFILALCLIFLNGAFTQECFFPPEFKYWETEISKVLSDFSPTYFRKTNESVSSWNDIEEVESLITYPIFYRWNYSGTFFAYQFDGKLVRKIQNKYKVIDNKNSCLIIVNRDKTNTVIDYEEFHINTYIWLRDNILIAIGYREVDGNIKLLYKKYTISTDDKDMLSCNIEQYEYPKNINLEEVKKMRLNWYEHRPDYFSE